MRDRRAVTSGATHFFALNAADRSGVVVADHIDALRDSFCTGCGAHPFVAHAICVRPDHLHLLMTLPHDVADFAIRMMPIERASG